MTTRTMAAVAEQMSKLADEMTNVAAVLRANRSRVPAHPHLSGLVLRSRRVVNLLRKHRAGHDGSMSLAREIVTWCEVLEGWREKSVSNEADCRLSDGVDAAARFVRAHAQEVRS